MNADQNNINPDYVQLGLYGKDVAYDLTLNLVNLPDPPTAIFTISDYQALGCLAAILGCKYQTLFR